MHSQQSGALLRWNIRDIGNIIKLLQYFIPPLVISVFVIYFQNRFILKRIRIINRSILDTEIRNNVLHFLRVSPPFNDDPWDFRSQKLYELNVNLVDNKYLGKSNDYIVEKGSWFVRGLQVQLDTDIFKETSVEKTIIPTYHLELSIRGFQPEIKVNALYVLSDLFFKERKMI